MAKANGRARGKANGRKRPVIEAETSIGKISNSKARKALIREKHRELCGLESQLEDIAAKRKAINKKIGDAYRTLKSELGISRKSAEFQRNLCELDKNERLSTIDEMTEMFEALRPGEQLSMFSSSTEEMDETPPPPPIDNTLEKY